LLHNLLKVFLYKKASCDTGLQYRPKNICNGHFFYTGVSVPQVIGLGLIFQDESGEFLTNYFVFLNNDSYENFNILLLIYWITSGFINIDLWFFYR